MFSIEWWTMRAPVIAGIAHLGTFAAAIIAAIALWNSVVQLKHAGAQIQAATLSIRASTAFQVSQEGRNIARAVRKNPQGNVGFIFSFVHMAWYQNKLGALDDDIWEPINAEVCAFLKAISTEAYFTAERKKQFNEQFASYMDKRIQECAK